MCCTCHCLTSVPSVAFTYLTTAVLMTNTTTCVSTVLREMCLQPCLNPPATCGSIVMTEMSQISFISHLKSTADLLPGSLTTSGNCSVVVWSLRTVKNSVLFPFIFRNGDHFPENVFLPSALKRMPLVICTLLYDIKMKLTSAG